MEDINEFLQSKENESWWSEWASWIQKNSGSLDETKFNHNNEFQIIENAPGSYVKNLNNGICRKIYLTFLHCSIYILQCRKKECAYV